MDQHDKLATFSFFVRTDTAKALLVDRFGFDDTSDRGVKKKTPQESLAQGGGHVFQWPEHPAAGRPLEFGVTGTKIQHGNGRSNNVLDADGEQPWLWWLCVCLIHERTIL